jgi:hypothetical protein
MMNAPACTRPAAQRLAAPAPANDDDGDADAKQLAADEWQHQVCEAWSSWCRTRRFFGRPSLPASLLGKLAGPPARDHSQGGPDAVCNAQLAALHLAVLAQPVEALDRQAFEAHYLWRVRNIKAAAAALGVSRQHWYRLVRDFRTRVCNASLEIQRDNEQQAACLPSRAA